MPLRVHECAAGLPAPAAARSQPTLGLLQGTIWFSLSSLTHVKIVNMRQPDRLEW